MAHQYSVSVRNAGMDARQTTIGTSPVLKFFSGVEPANCAAADPAGLLATLTLPATWMAAAAAGVKAKSGSWTGTGSAAGTIASYRIYDSGLVACHVQGTVTATGGGGDMTVDNAVIANGQAITVNTYQWTAGNS
jgi:hypothetical protein